MGALDALKKGASAVAEYSDLPCELIYPDPNQPRKNFPESELAELAATIKEVGLIQPISVRKDGDGKYIILAGERRFRAVSQVLGLPTIKSVIKEIETGKIAMAQLIENIQRADLGPVAEGFAIEAILEAEGITAMALAERIGKSNGYISTVRAIAKSPDVAAGYIVAQVAAYRYFMGSSEEVKEQVRELARERGRPSRQIDIRALREAEAERLNQPVEPDLEDDYGIQSNSEIEADLREFEEEQTEIKAPAPSASASPAAPVSRPAGDAPRTEAPSPRAEPTTESALNFQTVQESAISNEDRIGVAAMDLLAGASHKLVPSEARLITLTAEQVTAIAVRLEIDRQRLLDAIHNVLG